jgi:ATP-binding cassette, subfamily B (MDR/TAP), member 1
MFFPAGETTFIVGKSGSGKSTLSSLLLGFYDVAGDLTIDGEYIHLLDKNWLRNNITVVQQQTVLFNETILKNITFGLQNYAQVEVEDIEECIKFAALENTILSLPDGLETQVGVDGNSMSGGQRQRIALARAKLRNAPILILDEATSGLDKESASIVMEGVRKWRKNKTTIIITHDLSQVLLKDYIYVLENGRVVQEGYRDSLEQSLSGPFTDLLQPQWMKIEESLSTPVTPASQIWTTNGNSTSRVSLLNDATITPSGNRKTMSNTWAPIQDLKIDPGERRTSMTEVPQFRRWSNANLGIQTLHSFQDQSTTYNSDRPSTSLEFCKYLDKKSPGTLVLNATKNPQSLDIDGRGTKLSHEIFGLENKLFTTESPDQIQDQESENESARERSDSVAHTDTLNLRAIYRTIWPSLTWRHRFNLVLGICFAGIHAATTPIFSWVFSRLLGTYFSPHGNRAEAALMWSVAVLGIAVVDAVASFYYHFLLEKCAQAWIDSLRYKAYARILDQPRSWFEDENHQAQPLVECLDRNGEEMRNLLGRFTGIVVVTVIMLTIALIWCLILCWKLTLVGLATGPFMYAVSSMFQTMNARWEKKCNDAAEIASGSFAETFGNIRTVRALTLEGYFHRKHAKAINIAMVAGVKRAFYTGIFFGTSDTAVVLINGRCHFYFHLNN